MSESESTWEPFIDLQTALQMIDHWKFHVNCRSMWIILTIFCVILGSGLVLGPMLALEYWRQDGPIAAKLVGLTIGRTLFDLVSLVALLYVWNRDLVSEWWLVILWLPIIGLCTAAFKFTEIKLARGVSFPNR